MATEYPELREESISEKVGKTVTTNAPLVIGKVISIALFGFVRVFRGILRTIMETIRG